MAAANFGFSAALLGRKPLGNELWGSVGAVVLIASGATADPYDRALYKHWIDANHDCEDTRTEVLIIESVVAVTLDASGCHVLKGKRPDPYTGRTFTNPRQLDVDHLVPSGRCTKAVAIDGAPSADRTTPTTSATRTP